MKKIVLLLSMGLLLFSCGPQENPQEKTEQLSLEELEILEQAGVDNESKYEDAVFADGTNMSEWAKIYNPHSTGAHSETKSTEAPTTREKKKLFVDNMTEAGHGLTNRQYWSLMVSQINGLAYVFGSKSTDEILIHPESECSAGLYGLDCSGMIKVMAAKSFLYLSGEGTVHFANVSEWNNAFNRSELYKGLKMTNLGQINVSDFQAGDIIVKAGKHIGMVFDNGKGILKIYNSLGSPKYTCSKNSDFKHGPLITNNISNWITDVFNTGYNVLRIFYDDLMPQLTTKAIISITENSAISGGNITDDGDNPLISRGICWSTNPAPTIYHNRTTEGTNTEEFTSNITGLQDNTVYYVRAYAINVNGTAYGNELSFKTTKKPDNSTTPSITTEDITNITTTTASCSGNVTSDGGSSVTARGVCWSTSQNPTTSNSKTTNGTGLGTYTSNITGLSPNTTYYVRAYATNSQGTAYGEQRTFKTLTASDIEYGSFTDTRDGKVYKTVTIGFQVWMAENLAYLPSVVGPATGSEYAGHETDPYYYVYGYDGTSVATAKATTNYQTYGVLYNWPAALTACPPGWHLPSDAEWTQLEIYLGMSPEKADDTGWRGPYDGKLKSGTNHWNLILEEDTNESGFTALPGGYREGHGIEEFYGIGVFGSWWTSTDSDSDNVGPFSRILAHGEYVQRDGGSEQWGSSVRCIKD